MNIDISLAVCTSERLQRARSFIRAWQERFPELNLIVVENSLLETNFAVLKLEFQELDNLYLMRSEPPGLSRARNLALSEVRTRYVYFTDDDCDISELDPEDVVMTFKSQNATVVAGQIKPIWPERDVRHQYLEKGLLAALTITDFGDKPRMLADHEYAYGANFALDRKELSNIRFREDLGRIGNSLLSGEEVELQDQVRKIQGKVFYTPNSAVNHHVDPSRLTPDWFIKRFAWQGVTDALSANTSVRKFLREFSFTKCSNPNWHKLTEPSWTDLESRVMTLRATIFGLLDNDSEFKENLREAAQANLFLNSNSGNREVLLIDFIGGHHYILETLQSSELQPYLIGINLWKADFTKVRNALKGLLEFILRGKRFRKIVFTTFDPFLMSHLMILFLEFVDALPAGIEIDLQIHRNEGGSDISSVIGACKQQVKIHSPSHAVVQQLLSQGVSVDHVSVVGSLRPFDHFGRTDNKADLKIGLVGEIRSESTINFLRGVEHQLHMIPQITFVVLGSTRGELFFREIVKLRKRLNIDLRHFMFNSGPTHMAVAPSVFRRELMNLTFALKVENQSRVAASGVILDCLAVGLPVFALRDSEAGSYLARISPNLAIDDFNASTILELSNSTDKTLGSQILTKSAKEAYESVIARYASFRT